MTKKFSKRYSNPDTYCLSSCVYLAFSVDADMKDYPDKFIFDTKPFTFESKTYDEISINHYCFDNFAPKGKSVMICVISTDENDYSLWKRLKQEPSRYKAAKESLSNTVIACLEEKFPDLDGKIATLDVATPVTYERYCNAYKGAWMAFASTEKSQRMMHDGKIKGIQNMYMVGQWLIPPGGLPVAIITSKWAIQRICKKEKIVVAAEDCL